MSENQTVTTENQTAGDEKPTIVAVFTSPNGDTVRAELHGEGAAILLQRIDICLRTCAGVATEELESLPFGLNVLLPSWLLAVSIGLILFAVLADGLGVL